MADIVPKDDIINVTAPKSSYFNINSFRSEIWRNGSLPTHSYIVQFSPFLARSETAEPLGSFIKNFNNTLTMRCDSALLPGVNIMTSNDVRRYGYGPIENVPHGVIFNDITLNWIIDDRGFLVKFFNDWVSTIVNYGSYGGADMQTETQRGSISFAPYEVGYKDDYSNPKMSIFVYNRELDTVMEYQIFDVFPKSVLDTPIQWGEQDTLMKLSVMFSFTDMKIIHSSIEDFEAAENSISSLIEKTFGGSVSQTLSTIF